MTYFVNENTLTWRPVIGTALPMPEVGNSLLWSWWNTNRVMMRHLQENLERNLWIQNTAPAAGDDAAFRVDLGALVVARVNSLSPSLPVHFRDAGEYIRSAPEEDRRFVLAWQPSWFNWRLVSRGALGRQLDAGGRAWWVEFPLGWSAADHLARGTGEEAPTATDTLPPEWSVTDRPATVTEPEPNPLEVERTAQEWKQWYEGTFVPEIHDQANEDDLCGQFEEATEDLGFPPREKEEVDYCVNVYRTVTITVTQYGHGHATAPRRADFDDIAENLTDIEWSEIDFDGIDPSCYEADDDYEIDDYEAT